MSRSATLRVAGFIGNLFSNRYIIEQRGWALSRWKHAGFILPLVIAFAALVVIPAGAMASEGHAAPRWGDFGWRVLNFVIFAGILWYFVGGLAKRFFKNRREGIQMPWTILTDVARRPRSSWPL